MQVKSLVVGIREALILCNIIIKEMLICRKCCWNGEKNLKTDIYTVRLLNMPEWDRAMDIMLSDWCCSVSMV